MTRDPDCECWLDGGQHADFCPASATETFVRVNEGSDLGRVDGLLGVGRSRSVACAQAAGADDTSSRRGSESSQDGGTVDAPALYAECLTTGSRSALQQAPIVSVGRAGSSPAPDTSTVRDSVEHHPPLGAKKSHEPSSILAGLRELADAPIRVSPPYGAATEFDFCDLGGEL